MPIIRNTPQVSSVSAGGLEVEISHTDDSISLGDGTNTVALQDVGGVKSLPVKVQNTVAVSGAGDASSANQTNGTQRTKITDGTDNAEIDDVGGEKALKVSVISSVGGGSAPAETDGALFTADASLFTPIGAVYGSVNSLNSGDMGTLRCTTQRALHVDVQNQVNVYDDNMISNFDFTIGAAHNSTGLIAIGGSDGTNARRLKTDADGNLQVDVLTMPTVAVTGTFWQATQPVSGTVTVQDGGGSITVDGTVAVTGTFWQATQPVSGTVTANLAAGTNNIGDVDVLTLPSLPAGTNNIGDVDVLTLPGVAGTAAHDAAVSGNPVRTAGRAMLANGTAVAEDDTVDFAADNQGRQLVTLHVPRDLTTQGTATLTSTSETTLLSAGAAGVFHDLTKLILTNSSSTATRVALKDATTGTTRLEIALAANGGAVVDFGSVPMCQTTAANNWTVTLSGAVTSVYCYAQAIKRIA